MAAAKTAHALVTYYAKAYEKKYGEKAVFNRYSARWGFDAILMEMPKDEAEKLIDYYFETQSKNGHQLEWLFYNYDKLMVAKQKADEDDEFVSQLRNKTRQRVEEWRKAKRGNN